MEITDAITHDATGYCPYTGMTLTGWPITMIARGEVIVDQGELLAERGRGRFLPRAAGDAARPSGPLVPEMDPRATSAPNCSIKRWFCGLETLKHAMPRQGNTFREGSIVLLHPGTYRQERIHSPRSWQIESDRPERLDDARAYPSRFAVTEKFTACFRGCDKGSVRADLKSNSCEATDRSMGTKAR